MRMYWLAELTETLKVLMGGLHIEEKKKVNLYYTVQVMDMVEKDWELRFTVFVTKRKD
jgi:hypothetical protein